MLDTTRTPRSRAHRRVSLGSVVHFKAVLAVTIGALQGCTRIEAIIDRSSAATPHEAYEDALSEAGLAGTALVRRWVEAAEGALARPITVHPPYEETAYFPSEDPVAVGYRVSLKRGQALLVTVQMEPVSATGVFLDLFQPATNDGEIPRHLTSAPSGSARLEFESSRDGEFLLRVQTELLQPVRLTLRIMRAATLAFPVMGRDLSAIRSGFGAPRDGGRRRHHGVDIFAPRGTPVVAAADGQVSRVQRTRLGGNVVWLRDADRRQSLYYAHLDRQLVRRGQRVRAGDTLGLVGNTGNARTTPPHLHFGLYRRGEGPVDPVSFIEPQPSDPPPLRIDPSLLGELARTTSEARVTLAGGAEEGLPPQTVLKLLGAAGRSYRFVTPDGRIGRLAGSALEPALRPVGTTVGIRRLPLLNAPRSSGLTAAVADAGDTLQVLGRFGEYLFVEAPAGSRGWVTEAP
jgi:murein DD-endopeptidase MepM/ murein hydrolase activator NlpD